MSREDAYWIAVCAGEVINSCADRNMLIAHARERLKRTTDPDTEYITIAKVEMRLEGIRQPARVRCTRYR